MKRKREVPKRRREIVWRGDKGEGTVFRFVEAEGGKLVSPRLYLSYRVGAGEGTKEIVVSAETEKLKEAKAELFLVRVNRENAGKGKEALVTPKLERLTVGDLLTANIKRAERAQLASLPEMRYQTEILRKLLGRVRAVAFRPEHGYDYRERRLRGEGTRDGKKVGEKAIKNELGILTTAFKEAVKDRLLMFAPFIEKPRGSSERKKEIPVQAYYGKILPAMTDSDNRDFVEWMLLTARRPKGIGELRWEWWNEKKATIQMPEEKDGNPTVFSVRGWLQRVFDRRLAARRPDCPFIFHRGGEPMDDASERPLFYEALKACGFSTGQAAGFTLYDTKKTAMGLMVDAGLSVEEIMAFSGHKDRKMVERYIVRNAARQGRSVDKRDAYLEQVLAESQGADAESSAVLLRESPVN